MIDPVPDFRAALAALPLFPLPGAVLFPGALLPLHVFEPRYQKLLADCLATHRALAVVLVNSSGPVDDDGHPPIATVAGVGSIVEHEPLPEGRSYILVNGRARVALEELPFSPPYRRAKATLLPEPEVWTSETDVAGLVHAAARFVSEVTKRGADAAFEPPSGLRPGELADACAQQLVLDADVRQELLETLDANRRMRRVTEELMAQCTALEIGGRTLH